MTEINLNDRIKELSRTKREYEIFETLN